MAKSASEGLGSMRMVQSKRELGWRLGPEQDLFTTTFSIMRNGGVLPQGLGWAVWDSWPQQRVPGSPWPAGIRAVAPYPTTCSAWHRTYGCQEHHLVQDVSHYEKQEEAICPLSNSQFFRSSIGSPTLGSVLWMFLLPPSWVLDIRTQERLVRL